MSLQIGTDASVADMEHMGAPFVTKLDIIAWAPLCKVRREEGTAL